jgi:hypothetical protein
MKFQSGIYFFYMAVSIGYLAYRRAKIRRARKKFPHSIDDRCKEDFLAWLANAKRLKPNEPSEVYKYWFLTCQKTSDSKDRETLLNAFVEKRRAIEAASHDSMPKILGKIPPEYKPDDEFVRILYYHFLLLSIFTEEKIRLETTPIDALNIDDGVFDVNSFRDYLDQESFEIAFRDLLPGKLEQLSELSRHDSIDTNIVNFFDEDISSGIRLDGRGEYRCE